MFKIEVKQTISLLRRASFIFYSMTRSGLLYYIVFFGGLINMIIRLFSSGNDLPLPVMLAPSAITALVFFGLIRKNAKLLFQRIQSALGSDGILSYVFDENGIALFGKNGASAGKLEYKNVSRVISLKDMFLVIVNKISFIALPKSAFTQGRPEDFSEYVKSMKRSAKKEH